MPFTHRSKNLVIKENLRKSYVWISFITKNKTTFLNTFEKYTLLLIVMIFKEHIYFSITKHANFATDC